MQYAPKLIGGILIFLSLVFFVLMAIVFLTRLQETVPKNSTAYNVVESAKQTVAGTPDLFAPDPFFDFILPVLLRLTLGAVASIGTMGYWIYQEYF